MTPATVVHIPGETPPAAMTLPEISRELRIAAGGRHAALRAELAERDGNPLPETLLARWEQGTRPEKVAAHLYRHHVQGKKPGTVLPVTENVMRATGASTASVTEAKRMLAAEKVLRKEHGTWAAA